MDCNASFHPLFFSVLELFVCVGLHLICSKLYLMAEFRD